MMPAQRTPKGRGRLGRVLLIAVDLDDTILTPSQLMTRRSTAAVRSVRAAGIPVIPATSRGVLSILEVLPLAPFGPLALCANGAATLDCESGAVIRERAIELASALAFIEALRAAIPSISLGAETTTALFGELWIMKRSMRQSDQQVVRDTGQVLRQPPLKLLAAAPDMEPDALAAAIMGTIGPTVSLTRKQLWVELCAVGVSKVSALEEIASLLGVDRAHILSVGDAENDLDMLNWAGMSAAVKNAIPSVLTAADIIVPSTQEDGVAVLFEELLANDFMLAIAQH
jgi:Cof subfamily protein (haloacid dehalogenase superfamily)